MKSELDVSRQIRCLKRCLPPRESIVPIGSEQHFALIEEVSEAFKKKSEKLVEIQERKRTGIYPLTGQLAFGRDPEPTGKKGYQRLGKEGVTHILNLRKEHPSRLWLTRHAPKSTHIPLIPLETLYPPEVEAVLRSIHQMIHSTLKPRVLVHCWKGVDRSPTAVWLYLVLLGFSPEVADRALRAVHGDAQAAHEKMITRTPPFLTQLRTLSQELAGFRSDLFKTLFPLKWPN